MDIICNFCGRKIAEGEDFYSFPYEYHEGGEMMRAVHREARNMCTDCDVKIQKQVMRIIRG